MGKAGFVHLHADPASGCRSTSAKTPSRERDYKLYEMLDLGDIVGVEGYLFRTRTGELSVHAEKLDVPFEDAAVACPRNGTAWKTWRSRYRQRYLDLIANPEVRRGLRDPRAASSRRCAASSKRAASSKWKRP